MYYALLEEERPIYKLDEQGNKIVAYEDTSTTPHTIYYEELGGTEKVYSKPYEFYGNIAMSGNDINRVEYGISEANYEAILECAKHSIPITETSLIWFNTKPQTYEETVEGVRKVHAKPGTADYTILRVSPSLNVDKYILGKVVK